MKVFKFGGASVNGHEKIRNLASILAATPKEPLLIVVSAMGKTTNALEKVAEAFYAGKKEEALQLFRAIKLQHLDEAKFLLVKTFNETLARMNDFFTEVEWLLHDKPVQSFDYYYDQIVCVGELLSTTLVAAYLQEDDIACSWIDIRDVVRTDDQFRDANVTIDYTLQQAKATIAPVLQQKGMVVTQGFIGCTDENESTTLGREGSDYTAALLANMLEAEAVVIWKDVPGVMNADPKAFPEATLIPELNYKEVIEVTYYGAQVIHPKTIKPLQNKSIPLFVKSFQDPSLPGTVIHNHAVKTMPCMVVRKEQQVLMQLQTADYSFVGEQPMGMLYQMMAALHIRPNLIQTGAVAVQLCLDDHPEKIEKLAAEASRIFEVQLQKGLRLLTMRHPQERWLEQLMAGEKILLRQESKETIQLLMQ